MTSISISISISNYDGNDINRNYCLSINIGALVNARNRKSKTPIMYAAAEGHLDIMQLLIEHGADLTIRNDRRENLLHICCESVNAAVVEFLLSKKGNEWVLNE